MDSRLLETSPGQTFCLSGGPRAPFPTTSSSPWGPRGGGGWGPIWARRCPNQKIQKECYLKKISKGISAKSKGREDLATFASLATVSGPFLSLPGDVPGAVAPGLACLRHASRRCAAPSRRAPRRFAAAPSRRRAVRPVPPCRAPCVVRGAAELEHNANVNAVNYIGATPLHYVQL